MNLRSSRNERSPMNLRSSRNERSPMNPTHNASRRRAGALVLAGALALSACGDSGNDEAALSVDGVGVSFDELIGDIDPLDIQGEGEGTVRTGTVADLAQQRILEMTDGDPSNADISVASKIGTWNEEFDAIDLPEDLREPAFDVGPANEELAGIEEDLIDGGLGQELAEPAFLAPFDETAATVDGVEIPGVILFSEIEEQAAVEELAGTPSLLRVGDGFDTTVVAQATTDRVVAQLAQNESDARGLVVSDEVRSEVEVGLGQIPEGFSEGFVEELIDRQAMFQTLVVDLVGPNPPSSELTADTLRCARHILVASEEEADEVIGRLDGGEAFEDVAIEVSTDGSSVEGGNLGCADPSQYVPEFADALTALAVGERSGAVESQFGFHIIERTEPTADDVERERTNLQNAEQQAAFQEWVQVAVSDSAIEIDPRIGIWDPFSGVVPA